VGEDISAVLGHSVCDTYVITVALGNEGNRKMAKTWVPHDQMERSCLTCLDGPCTSGSLPEKEPRGCGYSLDLRCPPKVCMVNAWSPGRWYQEVAGPLRGGAQREDFWLLEAWLPCLEVGAILLHISLHDALPGHRPKAAEPKDQG
jgi:hypothetical protein